MFEPGEIRCFKRLTQDETSVTSYAEVGTVGTSESGDCDDIPPHCDLWRQRRIPSDGDHAARGFAIIRMEEETSMATARLRVFPHPDEDYTETNSPSIPVRLCDLYPLLAQAYRDNYVWLKDFEQDQLMVSNDLFEVIRAFSSCRPSA
jgi:hypothetical protein